MIEVESKSVSPEELAVQCQRGSRDSFELLVERFGPRIFQFLFRYVGNSHDAEDLTQETFVSAFRSLGRYDPTYSFSTWLFTIAKRTAQSHHRSRGPARSPHREPSSSEDPLDVDDPSAVLSRKDDRNSIWDEVRQLKPKLSEVLWLRYGEEFSVAETARIMGTNVIHVKVLLHRARSALAKKLRSCRDGVDGVRHEVYHEIK